MAKASGGRGANRLTREVHGGFTSTAGWEPLGGVGGRARGKLRISATLRLSSGSSRWSKSHCRATSFWKTERGRAGRLCGEHAVHISTVCYRVHRASTQAAREQARQAFRILSFFSTLPLFHLSLSVLVPNLKRKWFGRVQQSKVLRCGQQLVPTEGHYLPQVTTLQPQGVISGPFRT